MLNWFFMKRKIVYVFDILFLIFTLIYCFFYFAFVISWSWWVLLSYEYIDFDKFNNITYDYLGSLMYFWIISLSFFFIRLFFREFKLSKKIIILTLTINSLWFLTVLLWVFLVFLFIEWEYQNKCESLTLIIPLPRKTSVTLFIPSSFNPLILSSFNLFLPSSPHQLHSDKHLYRIVCFSMDGRWKEMAADKFSVTNHRRGLRWKLPLLRQQRATLRGMPHF